MTGDRHLTFVHRRIRLVERHVLEIGWQPDLVQVLHREELVHRLGVGLGEDDDRRCGRVVNVGGDDLALLVSDLVQLDLQLVEQTAIAALDQQRYRLERACGDDLARERLDPVEDRLVASEKRELVLHLGLGLSERLRPFLHFVDHAGDLTGEVARRHAPQFEVGLLPRELVDARARKVKGADDGSHPYQQVLHAVTLGGLPHVDGHVLHGDLAGVDLLGEVLDMKRSMLMEKAHDIHEPVLRSDDLDLCHRDEHVEHLLRSLPRCRPGRRRFKSV